MGSFVELSDFFEKTLGDNSSFGSEVNNILFHLQFQDICKQMNEHIIEILEAVQKDLGESLPAGGPPHGGRNRFGQ